jgi:hypothetical protein
MRRSLKVHSVVVTVFALIIAGMVAGCSSKEKLETQISGSWQRTQGDGTVVINLEKSPISLVFDGKAYAATINNVDMGNNSVHLHVATESGTSEEWILHQVWMTMDRHSSWPSRTTARERYWCPPADLDGALPPKAVLRSTVRG